MVNVRRRIVPAQDARLALLKLLPRVSKRLTALLALLAVAEVMLSAGFLLASGSLVGRLPQLVNEAPQSRPWDRIIPSVATIAVALVLMQSMGPFREAVTQAMGRRLEAFLRTRLMTASFSQDGIVLLEDPASVDLISQAKGVAMGQYTPALALWGLVDLVLARLRVLSLVVLITVFSYWWLAVSLFVVLQLVRMGARRPVHEGIKILAGTAQPLRRASYFLDLALKSQAAKEARIFGLAGWIVDRVQSLGLAPMEKVWAERRKIVTSTMPWLGLIVLVVMFLAVSVVGQAAVRGQISLTNLAIVAPAIMTLAVELLSFSHTTAWLEHGSTSIPAALKFEGVGASRPDHGHIDPTNMPQREIRFENVTFTYPGTASPVFRNLNLTLPAGRSVAIVGENGAGKTTLVKLLCRLYEPTGGRITVDGVDLQDLDLFAWRRRLSVILQDFARYEYSVRENVVFGALEHAHDDRALAHALECAGATEVVSTLPHGVDTVLSRRYERGTDLSGGQWQRIALARALFAVKAGAGVLALDEPTASMDVRAEAELYDRLLEITRDLTTILISHRFSTVRRADVICVIEDGQVSEYGSHEELLAAHGRYATMYLIQASRFSNEQGGGHAD